MRTDSDDEPAHTIHPFIHSLYLTPRDHPTAAPETRAGSTILHHPSSNSPRVPNLPPLPPSHLASPHPHPHPHPRPSTRVRERRAAWSSSPAWALDLRTTRREARAPYGRCSPSCDPPFFLPNSRRKPYASPRGRLRLRLRLRLRRRRRRRGHSRARVLSRCVSGAHGIHNSELGQVPRTHTHPFRPFLGGTLFLVRCIPDLRSCVLVRRGLMALALAAAATFPFSAATSSCRERASEAPYGLEKVGG
ncbi:hypothetical protein BC628DRAFT_1101529 [Trametes gibbosa]|nr:hypothetical protein BC628DRAFT_1101529 [Trametes gibbosa]